MRLRVVFGVALVVRASIHHNEGVHATEGTLQVRADVHIGIEQALIGVARGLAIVRDPRDAAYGRFFLQPVGDHALLIATRSEIGRGFRAAITFERIRRATRVQYAILRLPGDQSLHAAVPQFELLLIEAVRRLDPEAEVRLVGRVLRDLDGLDRGPAAEQENKP